jgi:hypothetical protein
MEQGKTVHFGETAALLIEKFIRNKNIDDDPVFIRLKTIL